MDANVGAGRTDIDVGTDVDADFSLEDLAGMSDDDRARTLRELSDGQFRAVSSGCAESGITAEMREICGTMMTMQR